jgi:tetratricopeptide (TPR) repeat protein
MPSNLTPDLPPGTFGDADSAAASLPGNDLDPVRSPDEAGAEGGNVQELESSSDVKSMDSLLPGPGDDETGKRKKKDDVLAGAPKETSKEDITVGKYYLDQKNWRAALSRFQSALVLAPEDPEVYWGLAESSRHMGNFADARANYLKVIEYDPGSRHAKDAQKALKDPEIENAKAVTK